MTQARTAKFGLGQIVRHRHQAFKGVVIDVDAVYAGPGEKPGSEARDQPFYQVLALGDDSGFIVYAAESILEHAPDVEPLASAIEAHWFNIDDAGRHTPRLQPIH